MKINKILIVTVGAVLSVNIALPDLVFANPIPVNPNSTTTPKVTACTKIATVEEKADTKSVEQAAKLERKQQARLVKLKDIRDEINTVRNTRRAWWDENRTGNLKNLEKRAKTDVQKAAVATFKVAAQAAVDARRAAVDAAVNAYRSGVDQLVAARQTAASTTLLAFTTASKAAIDRAKTDCANAVSSKIVRQNLKTDLKTVREKFASDRKAIEKIIPNTKDLAATKKAAFTKAAEAFKAAIEAARAQLLSAFQATKTATTTAQ